MHHYVCDDPIPTHLIPYPDQDTARHQGGDDQSLAHLTQYLDSDMVHC
jgi:hypothetical protein